MTEEADASWAYAPSGTRPCFDLKLARPFIHKSASKETRAAYRRAIREFFNFVGHITRLT